jgi:hypothetical protein
VENTKQGNRPSVRKNKTQKRDLRASLEELRLSFFEKPSKPQVSKARAE